MSALFIVLAVTGLLWWGCLFLLTVLLALSALARRRRPRPQVGDDVIARHARWRDEQVTAELERILSEGDGRG